MAIDITIKNPDGSKIYYPKTVSDLVYDNDNGKTVKEELDEIKVDVFNEFEITEKIGYWDKLGNYINEGNYHSKFTGLIPVDVGDKFEFIGYGSSNVANFLPYNENKEFIEFIAGKNYKKGTIFEITNPNYKYIRFNSYVRGTEVVFGLSKVGNINDKIDKLDDRVKEIEDNYTTSEELNTLGGLIDENTKNIKIVDDKASSVVNNEYDKIPITDFGGQTPKGFWLLEALPTPTINSYNPYTAYKTVIEGFETIDCNIMFVKGSSSTTTRVLFKFVDKDLKTLETYAAPEGVPHTEFVKMQGVAVPKGAKYILHSSADSQKSKMEIIGYSLSGYSFKADSIPNGSITKDMLDDASKKVFDIAATVKEETEIEPDNVIVGFYFGDAKRTVDGDAYRGCDYYIKGKDKVYISSVDTFSDGLLKYALLDKDKEPIDIVQDAAAQYKNLEIDIPEGICYVRFNYRKSRGTSTVKVYGDSDIAFIKNDNIRNGSLTKDKFANGVLPDSPIKSITVANADKIGIIGDSYTESGYAVPNKSYIAKMSLFSDYNFVNFGQSGDIYVGRIYDVRRGQPKFGTLPYDAYNTKYSMLCCYTNDIKYMKFNDYLKCVQTAIDFFRGIGSEPIVCTEYHISSGSGSHSRMSALGNKAKENNCLYWNIVPYVDMLYNKSDSAKYAPFWGGTHAGTRTNALESDPYLYHLDKLERPMQSIKLFRSRTSLSTLDDLMFGNNTERAEKFKEIIVGDRCLANVSDADNCTTAPQVQENSEYGLLIQKKNVPFNKYALASVVLPAVSKDIEVLNLELTTDVVPKVYVQKTKQTPYPIPTKLANYYITYSTKPSVGAVYKCNEDNKEYTVKEVMTDDYGNIHLLASGSTEVVATNGTLTKISGTGDSTITYTFREIGYSSDVISNDTVGHWIEVSKNADGVYDISTIKNDVVDVDKVHFLITYNGTFNISDIKVNYSANTSKIVHRMPTWDFKTNFYNTNNEMLPSSTFGTAGVLDTNWNITPTTSYEQQQGFNSNPQSVQSIFKVSDTNRLTANISDIGDINHKATLEIWCRYFPAVNSITEDSYDYNDIYVSLYNDKIIMKETVGSYWKIIQFDVYPEDRTSKIEIYSNNKGVEVAYVSLKVNE